MKDRNTDFTYNRDFFGCQHLIPVNMAVIIHLIEATLNYIFNIDVVTSAIKFLKFDL